MAVRLRHVKLRDLGKYFSDNFTLVGFFPRTRGWMKAYQDKYIHCKDATIAPLLHFGGFAIVVNYMVDYKFNLKYEKWRKYH